MFDYVDRCSAWVELEHTRERELREREQRRMSVVRDAMAGELGDVSVLEYELTGSHVGAISWGLEAQTNLESLIDAIGAEALVVSPDRHTCWAWLGLSDATALSDRARAQSSNGVRLAIGSPAVGIEGFRQTHREARLGKEVAVRLSEPVVTYWEIALDALTSAEEERSRLFIARELGGLVGEDERSRTLRGTVRAYFASGHNASSAAAQLGVHERTIANRLRSIETLLGCSITARRAELETALRLRELLG